MQKVTRDTSVTELKIADDSKWLMEAIWSKGNGFDIKGALPLSLGLLKLAKRKFAIRENPKILVHVWLPILWNFI